MQSDQEILKRFLAGDGTACAELLERMRPAVLMVLHRHYSGLAHVFADILDAAETRLFEWRRETLAGKARIDPDESLASLGHRLAKQEADVEGNFRKRAVFVEKEKKLERLGPTVWNAQDGVDHRGAGGALREDGGGGAGREDSGGAKAAGAGLGDRHRGGGGDRGRRGGGNPGDGRAAAGAAGERAAAAGGGCWEGVRRRRRAGRGMWRSHSVTPHPALSDPRKKCRLLKENRTPSSQSQTDERGEANGVTTRTHGDAEDEV